MSDKKNEFLYMARLAEQTERYEDMVDWVKKYVEVVRELKDEERNLLSIAYKNAAGSRRTAWRAISALENKEKAKNSRQIEIIKYYKNKIERELESYCNDAISLIDNSLLKQSLNPEGTVFYFKMRGDYCRYLSEFLIGDGYKKASDYAIKSYQTATDIAEKDLKSTNAIRLGLALNCSVFHYEIKNDVMTAVNVAKKAFDEAIADLEHLEDEQYKDSTTIMQLLRDNITLWTQDLTEEGEKGEEKEKR